MGFLWPASVTFGDELLVFAGIAVVAMLVDLGGVSAAGQGGASRWTVVAAIAVRLVLAVLRNSLGILVGVLATVFAVE